MDDVMTGNRLTDEVNFAAAADVFKQLSDITRLRVFCLLCHSELCVSAISELMDMNSPAVCHHLKQLKNSGLIVSRRDGKEVYYKAADNEKVNTLHIATEKIMKVCCIEDDTQLTDRYGVLDKVKLAHQVHAYLLEHIGERITIEELSKQFLINPTTLKAAFKEVYGNSLAAHIKEHRMERAEWLLLTTSDSISQISEAVGFSSQSRFSQAFKKTYGVLPIDYRKQASAGACPCTISPTPRK